METIGTTAHQTRVLVVDDDDAFRMSSKLALDEEGFLVEESSSSEDAIALVRQRDYDVVLLDISLPGMDGMQALKIIRQESPSSDVVMMTGYQDVHTAVEAIKLGALEYLLKPIDPDDLAQRMKSLVRAHAAEQHIKNLQTEFTSRVLHEIAVPLATVHSAIGFLSKGMAGDLTDQQRDVLEHIEQNLSKMKTLLHDMIDLTLFESGQVTLERLATNLDELVPAICLRFKSQAAAKGIGLTVEVVDSIPTLEVDSGKIEQVVSNLLQNAITYTERDGSIIVRVTAANQGDVDGVEISVSDSGIGIPPGEVPFVFDKYKELFTKRVSSHKTTGMGLAICRSIVEAHRGTMSVLSEPGKGSAFRLFLPIAG
jgi:two-component system sensor histidine kinase/response regulator